jgi:hypothetical protein
VLSHRFLCSLLRSYGLEFHHLTHSGILHMVAIGALCEAYIGIEPPLNLWSHFFWARLRQGLDAGAASLGSVGISVYSRSGVDSYFSIPQPDPLVEWRKAWFLLKNETDVLLPVFMSGHLIPQFQLGERCSTDQPPQAGTPARYHPRIIAKGADG